jgi:hypothetical protein
MRGERRSVSELSIELADDMTLGSLRAPAQALGKRLVVGLENAPASRVRTPLVKGEIPAPRGLRRKMSPERRAALLKNLAKARAARSAKRRRVK